MNLTLSLVRGPIFQVGDHVHFPIAHEPAIERELFGTLEIRSIGVKHLRKRKVDWPTRPERCSGHQFLLFAALTKGRAQSAAAQAGMT